MFLLDTDVVSEVRKGARANAGVRAFLASVAAAGSEVFLSAITIGELRRGVELVRHRGDAAQARRLEGWLHGVVTSYETLILPFDADCAQVWGRLSAPNAENPFDKQIAATALLYGLTVVTRNVAHYRATGVPLRNPFH